MAKKKVATKKEKEWMRKVSELDCYCCGSPAEVHHIRKHTGMGLRPSHFDTIPLCSHHHRTARIQYIWVRNYLFKSMELNKKY